MAKSRSGTTRDDGLFAVHTMVREFSDRLLKLESAPTLAEIVVELLNGKRLATPRKERVERIIELLRFQRGYEAQARSRHRSGDQVAVDLYISALLDCNFELNEKLRAYQVTPQIDPIGAAPTLFFLAAQSSDDGTEESAEVAAVMCALQLAQQGHIDNVRGCSCGTFFVAGRIDQQHCSTKCRVKAHQSSEEFKAKRREADRERYRLHTDGKVKETNRRKSNGTQKAR